MNKRFFLFTLIIFVLILTACSEIESKEDVIQTIEENMDEVEKYFTDAVVEIILFGTNDEVIDDNHEVESVYRNDRTQESSGKMARDHTQIINYYSTTEATFAQMNDGPWQDKTSSEDVFKKSKKTYPNVAQIMIDLINEADFKMEVTDDKYIFSFTGKSKEVYEAFEHPYSLTLAIAQREDVEQDLNITVDLKTYLIEKIDNELSVEHEGQTLLINVSQTFEQINEIDDINIPQDVIDEAS